MKILILSLSDGNLGTSQAFVACSSDWAPWSSGGFFLVVARTHRKFGNVLRLRCLRGVSDVETVLIYVASGALENPSVLEAFACSHMSGHRKRIPGSSDPLCDQPITLCKGSAGCRLHSLWALRVLLTGERGPWSGQAGAPEATGSISTLESGLESRLESLGLLRAPTAGHSTGI
jgi:hypothetical protein